MSCGVRGGYIVCTPHTRSMLYWDNVSGRLLRVRPALPSRAPRRLADDRNGSATHTLRSLVVSITLTLCSGGEAAYAHTQCRIYWNRRQRSACAHASSERIFTHIRACTSSTSNVWCGCCCCCCVENWSLANTVDAITHTH